MAMEIETETETPPLRQRHGDLFASIYLEGILNTQFIEVHEMQRPEDPHFLRQLTDLFYQGSEKRLDEMAVQMEEHEVNYGRLYEIVRDLKDSSLTFGARRLVSICYEFITCYNDGNFEECVGCLEHIKDEYYLFKRRLETLLQLEHQILAAGGTSPVIDNPVLIRMLNPKCRRVYPD